MIAAHNEGFDQICAMSESLCFSGMLFYLFDNVLIEFFLDCFDGLDDWQFGCWLILYDIV